jgi:TolB-like protein
VLPFANLSNDPAQDYFADGVTENLTTDLSRIHNSFVIARNTAFRFKGKNLDAKAIGKELAVRYVLEGSVQRDQNRVRVNAQLIDVDSDAHLWADRFETMVRVYGCLAIIMGKGDFDVTQNGQDSNPRLLFSSIWAKRGPNVRFVSWESTSLPKP